MSTDSSTVFAAETTNAVVGNFTSVPTTVAGSNPGTSHASYEPLSGYSSLQGVSFTTVNSGGVVNVNSPRYYGASDLGVPYALSAGINSAAAPVLQITLPHAETAFALDFGSLFNSEVVTFTLSNGYTTSATTAVTTSGQPGFIGFVSSTPFDSITLTVPNADDNWTISEFTQAQASPVPLPAAAWLMLSGLGGLCVMVRKRKAASAPTLCGTKAVGTTISCAAGVPDRPPLYAAHVQS